ncbi:hypothetical protein [Dictyobacter arantiisoli]|uniref:Uncharacterized protein n=1 Tax=Dictyobacter arantiisoli TaxID=2014874 RepID=A0A5A5T854_9CHLR|nr:hypothetical protein [Dictyobacter arantiisoli]GCF07527.1 hypothetical protein KDI_10910 [Dictyobacter arantiisoli]
MQSFKNAHPAWKRTKQVLGKLMIGFLLLSALFTSFGSGIASAHSAKTADKLSNGVTYTMYVDCSKGSAAVRAREIKNHECPAQTRIGTNGVLPQNQVGGPCGTSYIYGSGAGFGFANFAVGGKSTLGGIIAVAYTITWYGGLAGPGLTTGALSPFGSSIWNDGQEVLTGSGRITAVLSGGVTLKSGTICTFNNPNTNFNA